MITSGFVGAFASALRRPVFTNTVALIIMRGTTIGARLSALFLIARFVSPAEFGSVAFVLSVVEIADIFADLGLDTLAVREFAIKQQVDSTQTFISSLAFTKILCGLIVYAALICGFAFQKDIAQTRIAAVLGLLILTALWGNLTIVYFQAKLRVNEILLPIVITNIGTIVLVGVMSLFQTNVLLTIAILPLMEAINLVILLRRLYQEVTVTRANFQLKVVPKLLHRTLPLAITTIIVTLYTRLDVVVLKSFLGTEAVAYYALAFRMTEPFLLLVGAFGVSIYSHLATTLVNGAKLQVRFLLVRYAIGSLIYGLLCCVLLAFVAPILIRTLLPRYIEAIPILRLLALALVFRTLNAPLNNAVLAFGQFSVITLIATFNLIMIGGLLFYFVPWLGAEGAAICLLIGEAVNTLIHAIILSRIFASENQ